MKIQVWRECEVMAELDLPDAPGPDIKLDPYNDLIGVWWPDGRAQIPTPYQANGLVERGTGSDR